MYISLKDKPIVFLDFDGVLSTAYTKEDTDFTPESIATLNMLYNEIPYSIVLTTSWRTCFTFKDISDLLAEKGVKAPVIDKTAEYTGPYTDNDVLYNNKADFDKRIRPDAGRNSEVMHYIYLHSINRYLILDDWLFTNQELAEHQINTNWFDGLNEEHLFGMVQILKESA